MNVISDTPSLEALCERLAKHEFVTVDTEFLRETTFWPKLCLIQVASDEEADLLKAHFEMKLQEHQLNQQEESAPKDG